MSVDSAPELHRYSINVTHGQLVLDAYRVPVSLRAEKVESWYTHYAQVLRTVTNDPNGSIWLHRRMPDQSVHDILVSSSLLRSQPIHLTLIDNTTNKQLSISELTVP